MDTTPTTNPTPTTPAPFCGDCHQRTTELQSFPGEPPTFVCTNLECTSHNVRRVRPTAANPRGMA